MGNSRAAVESWSATGFDGVHILSKKCEDYPLRVVAVRTVVVEGGAAMLSYPGELS